jgi:hypothetical protein
MNVIARTVVAVILLSICWAQRDLPTKKEETRRVQIYADSKTVAPGTLAELWKRPDLSRETEAL